MWDEAQFFDRVFSDQLKSFIRPKMDIIRQRQIAADGQGSLHLHNAQETLLKHLKAINMYDEVISSVQLDLQCQRLQANSRLKPLLAQLEQLEKIPVADYTAETRTKIENLERNLAEIRRNQVEIVEMSFQNMYELGHMVTREREELLLIN